MNARRKRHEKQPWLPADATRWLNEMGMSNHLSILPTDHAEEQMEIRGLLMGDVLHTLKRGFVYSPPEAATRDGYFKYAIISNTPNSASRDVKVIVIPDCTTFECKIVTVMWKDDN